MSFIKLQGTLLQRSLYLAKVQQIGTRNKHVIAFTSNNSIGHGYNERIAQKTLLQQSRLPVSCLGAGRNFSISAINRNAAAATTVTTVVETTATPVAQAAVAVAAVPELPVVPAAPTTPVEELVSNINALGEPTLASLGLGGWSPVGLLQNGLELIHVTTGLPWWGTIAVSTVIIRSLMTPVVVIAQRNGAKFQNAMPKIQEINERIAEAKQMGDAYGLAQHQQELSQFMQRAGCNPFKSMAVVGVSAPIFISYFIALRRMVNAPVEALETGGMLWFTDLTVKDPYFVLPAMTCATLWLVIRLGSDGAITTATNNAIANTLMKVFPIFMFPFMMKFPAALTVYWASSNMCSLVQGRIFKIPQVRSYLGLPQLVKRAKGDATGAKKQPLMKQAKETWSKFRNSIKVTDTRHLDRSNFERAGTAPLVRTYKFDPTKIKQKI